MSIVNTYDQLKAYGGDNIAICYQPLGDSRSMRVPGWYVSRLRNGEELKTDPRAAWYDYGRKFFMLQSRPRSHHEAKRAALAEAVAWANKQFGKREFVRNRLGDYVERQVNEKCPIPRREK